MLDPRIILSGEPVNALSAINAGTVAAQNTNAVQQQNALAGLYREQGPGILSGDPGAMNALAGLDPLAAVDVQQAQLGMESTRQTMARLSRDEERLIRDEAAKMDAGQRQAEAQKIEEAVKMGLAAPTPQAWDQLMMSIGAQDLVGQFDQRQMLAQRYMSVAEILKGQQGPEDPAAIQALRIRAAEGGLQPGTPEYQQFMAQGGMPSKTALSVGADGSVTFEQGAGVSEKPLTVDAAKNSGFLLRAQRDEQILSEYEAEGTGFGNRMAEGLPLGLGNYMQSPEYRKFDQARRDFVNAILRRESGAVINPEEFANAEKQYFPVPGDDPETIAQKKAARATAIDSLRIGAGAGAAQVDAMGQKPVSAMDTKALLDLMNNNNLTAEQIDEVEARLKELESGN